MTRVSVRIPSPLRDLVGRRDEVQAEGATVAAALEDMVARYPELRRHLLEDGGRVREYVNIYLNEDDVRHLDGIATPLSDDDTLTIVPSIAGGTMAAASRTSGTTPGVT